ncbi:mammalian ependymin-related protein 1-like [Liolophura sinensis]|uniref:mammalian ependymin-related protein 1-like n=1 Tax=Liolophura sinensis TaxID=3198878 RepID=UPI00315990A7
MRGLFVLALVVVTVYAQEPQRCATPTIWEARLFEQDRSKNFQRRAKLSYDEVNQRVRRIEEVDFSESRDFYDELFLHNVGIAYRLNLRTRVCNVTALSSPFRRVGIPTFAKFRGEGYIGASVPNAGVLVSLWDGATPDGGFYFGAWTVLDCVPVNDGYFSNQTGFISWNFFDVTLGISDPNVFVPPSECASQEFKVVV